MNKVFILLINVFLIQQSYSRTFAKNALNNQIHTKEVRAEGDPVKVTVYYENLNKFNRKFFVEQFRPVVDNLWDIIDLELVPYGTTTKEGTPPVFKCLYEDKQCWANRIQACVVSDPTQTADYKKGTAFFTHCMFKNKEFSDISTLAPHCVTQELAAVGGDWGEIDECEKDPAQGDKFYDEMREKTEPIKDKLVKGLAVGINGDIKAETIDNLVKAVCDAFIPKTGESKPQRCENAENLVKVKVGVYYETLNMDFRNYISRQIKPFFHIIEDMVDIELIPYGKTVHEQTPGPPPVNTFTCVDGDECMANRIQAIVVNQFIFNAPEGGDEVDGTNRAINFIDCMSTHKQWQNIYTAGEQCANQWLPIDSWRDIIIASRTPEGENIYLEMKEKTSNAATDGLPRVPFVTINGEESIPTLNDFVQEVCAKYSSVETIKPKICTKIEVIVYYEALHHQSRKFIMEELRPAFNHFQSLMTLKLLPSGRAKGADGGGFECEGGVEQCEAIKYQACIIDGFYNDGANWADPLQQEVMESIYCMEKNKHANGVRDAAEHCSEQNIEADPWPAILTCMKTFVDGIFDEYIEETESAGIDIHNPATVIPVVKVDGVVKPDANKDLIAVLCEHFDVAHRPDKCSEGKAPKVKVDVYYESMSELSKIFFSKQMTNFKHIEELIDLNLYPNGNVRDGAVLDGTCETEMPACVANKIQSIVVDWLWLNDHDGDQIDDTIKTTLFLSCIYSHPEWKSHFETAYKYCSDIYLTNDIWDAIILEMNTPEGHEIYKKVQTKTKELIDKIGTLTPVPYVMLDDKHSLKTANDLLQTVCDVYKGEKPLECNAVNVEVYYETLNPQTRKFFLEELKSVFDDMRESITFDLIPYGKTKREGTETEVKYVCPKGEGQCYANALQACAIKHLLHSDDNPEAIDYDGKNETIYFIHCMFKNIANEDMDVMAKRCADEHLVSVDTWFEDIMLCAKEPEQRLAITKEMEAKTGNIRQPLEQSPWIVVNGERVGTAQNQLREVICDKLVGDKPEVCDELRTPKVKVEFHYQTGDPSVKSFIIDELYPSYRSVEEIIDLEINPFGQTVVEQGDDGKYDFTCPNGIDECMGNKIHAVIHSYFWHNDDGPQSDNLDVDGRLQTMEFIECYFSHSRWPNPWTPGAECANQNFPAMWEDIYESVNQGVIDPYLAKMGENVSTLSPPLIYTPWITVNGKHSKAPELHFTRAVCDAYKGRTKPRACYEPVPLPVAPDVEVHYEPLNTESKAFILEQLDHLKTHVDEIVNLNLLPFGRTTKIGDVFTCPNDPECHTFKHHACIMDKYLQEKTIETLNFLICAFGDDMSNVDHVTSSCVEQHLGDVWGDITTCAHANGNTLLENMYQKVQSLNPKLSHVPWILVNSEHNLKAEISLIQEICDTYFPTEKPSQCIPEPISVVINYQTMTESVKQFFANQLKSIESYFDEMASIEFVPYGLTTRTGTNFVCPQGVDQCHGNQIHTCVVNKFYENQAIAESMGAEESRYRTVQFLICAFSKATDKPVTDAQHCLNEEMGGDYWVPIDDCAKGPEGTQLYTEMATKTEALDPKLDAVPWITINGKRVTEGETNLIHAICQSYSLLRPAVCSSLDSPLVDIEVYYSSDSVGSKWIVEHLKQFYVESTPTRAQSLQTMLSSSLIPWGKTVYNPDDKQNPFTCATANECTANRIHACAIEYHSTEPKGWDHLSQFVICFFSDPKWSEEPADVGNQCANKVWFIDPWLDIWSCATMNAPEYIDIFLKMKQKTEKINANKFPWITVKGEHNTNAENDLLATVCDNYSGIKPDECRTVTPVTPPVTSPVVPSVTTPVAPSVTTPFPPSVTTPVAPSVTTPVTPSDTTPVSPSDTTPTPVEPTVTTPEPTDGSGGAISLTLTKCLFITMSLILLFVNFD